MKLFAVSSIVLLVLLASAGLPLSQATKMIYDHGYVIFEGTGTEFGLDYSYYKPEIYFTLRDQVPNEDNYPIGRLGSVWIGDARQGPAKADIMRMSFVIELVGNGELPMSPMDEEQVWYKESSDALLDKVDSISGNVVIRELRRAERVQMEKFKKSPHAAIHQFQTTYKNGAVHFRTNVKETVNLSVGVMSNSFQLTASRDMNEPDMKSISLMEIGGKSFAVEDAEESNCDSLESSGFQGYCTGKIWVQKL